jgi:hypothetical protein
MMVNVLKGSDGTNCMKSEVKPQRMAASASHFHAKDVFLNRIIRPAIPAMAYRPISTYLMISAADMKTSFKNFQSLKLSREYRPCTDENQIFMPDYL